MSEKVSLLVIAIDYFEFGHTFSDSFAANHHIRKAQCFQSDQSFADRFFNSIID